MKGTENLNNLLLILSNIVKQDEIKYLEFEDTIKNILLHNNPKCIHMLLSIINDKKDDYNFMIIHAIETFDDVIYVDEIISVLSDIWLRIPRWSQIIFMRILNSSNTAQALKDKYRKVSTEQRNILSQIFNAITDRHIEFQSKVKDILGNS